MVDQLQDRKGLLKDHQKPNHNVTSLRGALVFYSITEHPKSAQLQDRSDTDRKPNGDE